MPGDEFEPLAARQHLLTVLDVVDEAHDTHHPLTVAFGEGAPMPPPAPPLIAGERTRTRLTHFERPLRHHRRVVCCPRVSVTQTLPCSVDLRLQYAFPTAMGALMPTLPRCAALQAAVAARPRIKAYLASRRRLPLNEHGIFRHYLELDFPLVG